MLLVLLLAATPGVAIGTGSRASTIAVSPVGRPSALGTAVDQVMLTDVISPHMLQRGYGPAAQFVSDLALGESVTFEPRPPDPAFAKLAQDEEVSKHGRLRLGKVWLHEALLAAGHAWVAPAARKDAALMKLEATAREAKLGLWAAEAPVEPWLWRELTMLGDRDTKAVHSGWECPHVQATQCKKCGGSRFYSLAEAKAAGFPPHEACFDAATLRIAEDSGGGGEDDPPRDEAPRKRPPHPRRACAKDAECALTAMTPCTCMGCGGMWHEAARKDVVQRTTANFAKVSCGGVGCPACAGHWLGTKAVCREGQCAVE